ncbi:penicillin-binding protein 2 [Blattabacterium sp. (Blatta orientalis) str. Tarazona]|uniref:penicillin-binding protein 2 n=1 Tax=Blattabacterium sp. (Blatta orientalis) TaxID=367806 RepID=UPI0002AD84EE|nr:penicillin-binding protein 2 [Blattabacterium sp. (Blatta orientalis)]AGD98484.1 penicillin-binding protein 2 [Blattabacterium sp. (Blatta orientalis) str. Tarazona]
MKKLYIFYILLSSIGLIFIIRLFYIQIYTEKYILNAFNTSIKQEIIIPERGSIFDRNNNLLVFNKSIYELIVIPMLIDEHFNIIEFCNLLGIEKDTFYKNLEKAKAYSKYLPSVFLPFISKEKFATIQEKLYKYKGFDWTKRSLRDYKVESSANILGYIGEVTQKDIKKESNYYQMGDFIGWAGVEKSYEKILRGKKGVKYWIRDRNGCIIGSYNNKKNNVKAISGNDIYLTIDWKLQDYAEKLMYQKKGGIVAINPKNGEILSLVSSPINNPNLFVGIHRSEEFIKLIKNTIDFPLLDRPTQARYPPASPFKLLTELAGLQMGVVDKNTTFVCYNGFRYGKKRIHCHSGIHGLPIGVETAVAVSCNNYFAQVYKRLIEKYPKNLTKGVNEWNEIIKSFGFGNYLYNDLATGEKGVIPSGDYYNKKYGYTKWNALTIISNSIGQGEINVTPIQLANMVCAIANKGFFYTPHIVKSINHQPISNPNYTIAKHTKVKSKYFNLIISGMEKVFIIGTGKSFRSSDIRMAGKTGTSQNFLKVNQRRVPLPDHSIFILFAPVEDPKIAISVIIENGGFGSRWAGPIASLLAEKYIRNKVQRKSLEKRIMTSGLQKVYDSIAKMKGIYSTTNNAKNYIDKKK